MTFPWDIFQHRGANGADRSRKASKATSPAPEKRTGRVRPPEWETALTESLQRNCVAPSEEVILHASDLYKRDLYEPLHVREQEMARLHSEITAGFSHLQALMPLAIERALSRNPWEFAHIIDHKSEE